jgi:hypothetical protein
MSGDRHASNVTLHVPGNTKLPRYSCDGRYAEQLKDNVEWRKEPAENAGLSFKLPSVERAMGYQSGKIDIEESCRDD